MRCSAKWLGRRPPIETAKVQKKIVRDCLTGEGRERVEGFLPRYIAFPIGLYDPNKTQQIATR